MTTLDDITKQAQESLALAERATDVEWTADDDACVYGPGFRVAVAMLGNPVTRAEARDDTDLIAHARTALPDLAKAWLAVCEALEENDLGMTTAPVAIIRAAILRRLSK